MERLLTFVQRLLGHASLATTGIYTQLADDMTKDIALNTPTALDEVLSEEEEALKEQSEAYQTGFEKWDAVVEPLLRGESVV